MWRALGPRARSCDVRAAVSQTRGVSCSRQRLASNRPSPAPSSSSIAGENTNEFLVKVNDVSMEAGLSDSQSTTRSRLLTLTSVAAAAYLAYFIFPLVGGGTASSAVKMCTSKDVIFRKAGVSRLRTVLRVSRDGGHVAHAVEHGACEILLRLITEDGRVLSESVTKTKGNRAGMSRQSDGDDAFSGTTKKSKSDERRLVAIDAAAALVDLAQVSKETKRAMESRTDFMTELRNASRDKALHESIRTKLIKVVKILEDVKT